MVVQKGEEKKTTKLGQQLWVGPTDEDMAIREAHPAMALLPSGQSLEMSRYCQRFCFIHSARICQNFHIAELPLCTHRSSAVKQYVGEIRHRYQNCTHKPQCEASLFPVGLVVGVFMCMTCLPQWEEKLLYQLCAVLTDSLKTHSAMKMWLLLCNRMHNITFVRSWGSLTHSTTWWLSQLQALSVLILRSAKSLSCSELMCTSPKVRKPTKINTNLWVASQLNWNSSCWKSWSCLCGGLCYGVWQVNWVNQN